MTINEFRVWLDGFMAGAGEGPPNDEQWQMIQGKLAEVKETLFPMPGPSLPHGDRWALPGTYPPVYTPGGSGDPRWPIGTVTCTN